MEEVLLWQTGEEVTFCSFRGDRLNVGWWDPCAVAAAVELDVFTATASGKTTANEIASAARAKEAMRRLLDALVALKYLARKGERYTLSPHAATYLVRGSELYMECAGRL